MAGSRRKKQSVKPKKEKEEEQEEEEEQEDEVEEDAPQAYPAASSRSSSRHKEQSNEEIEKDEDDQEHESDDEEDYEEEDQAQEEEEEEHSEEEEEHSTKKHARKRSSPTPKRSPGKDKKQKPASPLLRSVNPAGKPAEAGIIKSVYVENFMCHQRLTVQLCRNVNFIYGQNGSGKSAVLAAVQICLGAGARRTHRARNLKELIRKGGSGSAAHSAKVRVTLLNEGEDAYRKDIYGSEITVERCISNGGGYNGYRLLDVGGKERSKSKKDLDAMLDQLNIQVENPVAVLDQEEAKKFLMGKGEQKYAFFMKATELERIDRSYASVSDNMKDLEETKDRVRATLVPAGENVRRLEREWREYQELEKLEESILEHKVHYAWSCVNTIQQSIDEETDTVTDLEKRKVKRLEELQKAQSDLNSGEDQESILQSQMETLTEEAEKAKATKEAIEQDIKTALLPVKKQQQALSSNKREMKTAKKSLASAVRTLKETRDQIIALAGNAESEEAKRTAKLEKFESELAECRSNLPAQKQTVQDLLSQYEDLEPHVDQAKSNTEAATKQFAAVSKRVRDLSAGSGNSLAVFGQKCVQMSQKVEQATSRRQFQGPVIGPIGAFIKLAPGYEELAKIAEKALGGGTLDRFIVTTDADRKLYMKIRKEIHCGNRDCGVFQMPPSAANSRYNVPPSPTEKAPTVASVLTVEHDLVFNCLVDNCRIDQLAVSKTKEESEIDLIEKNPTTNKESVKGGNITTVFFLPRGDFWKIKNGYRSMTSNERPNLKQTIGIDRSAAIEEAKQEAELLKSEVNTARSKEQQIKAESKSIKIKWNQSNKSMMSTVSRIKQLDEAIEDLKQEAEQQTDKVTIDTTDLEEDVNNAEQTISELTKIETEITASIDTAMPEIDSLKKKREEIMARNERVVADMNVVEGKMESFVRNAQQRQAAVEKKKKKLDLLEEALAKQKLVLQGNVDRKMDALEKARILTLKTRKEKERQNRRNSQEEKDGNDEGNIPIQFTTEELDAVEPIPTRKAPDFYKAKIERALKQIANEREKRQLAETDPEVALEKYQRAKRDLDAKFAQIDGIESNVNVLMTDVKERRRRWKQFRKHIGDLTNETFDEFLNKKGSSGEIEFNHKDGRLNLIVQKDNTNEMSQTKDVKALSGGERSFTTLSLLLALGEQLETPFRVMDEFDVFLDPVSRKVALDTMIKVAKDMEHRQFIFITPQDLSSLTSDPMLKIHKMKNPDRDVGEMAQQTLDFASPSSS